MEIVGMLMNQDGFTNHIADPEPAGKDLKVRFSSMGKQRRQVSRVAGVEDIPGIIMPLGIGKGFAAAVTALVNMESEEIRFRFRQAAEIGGNQCAAAPGMKFHGSPDTGICRAAPHPGDCIGRLRGLTQHCSSRR